MAVMGQGVISGISQNLNQLLSLGYQPGNWQKGDFSPALDMDTRRRMQVAFNQKKKATGFGMGADTAAVGISLPKLLENYRQGVVGPIMQKGKKPNFEPSGFRKI